MTVSHRIERILCADGLIDISSAIVSENKRKVLVCLAVPFVVGDRADQIRNAVIDGTDGDLLLGITQSVVVGQIDHRTGIVEPTSENPVFGVRRLDDSITDNSDRIQRQRLSGIGCREDVEPRSDVAGQLAVSVVSQACCHCRPITG